MSAITELIKRKRRLRLRRASEAASSLEIAKNAGFPTWNIENFLFKEQLDFVHDPARKATAVCSVRAGKTVACVADLIDTALKTPGTNSYYITLARSSAERICWPVLKKINREFQLGGIPNEAKLTMKFPRVDSMIYLLGANNEQEIEKIRGVSDTALVYLDEAQAFREFIKALVEEILVKRLYDLNGRLRMIGTPGPVLSGYFYRETEQSQSWAHHHWTMHSNPWLLKKSGLTPEQLIEQDCKDRGVDISHPSIQRECFGRWMYDPESLLLQYQAEVNDYDKLPEDKYEYILGIDLGSKAADSLSLLAYSPASPKTWLVEEFVTPNQKTDDLAVQINKLVNRYGDMTMVADTGGLGLKIVEDLMARYGFVIGAADKKGKITDYKLLNNALRNGMFMAKKETRFAQDCNILERDDDKSTPEKIIVKGHSDAVDSTLYAFGLSPAYNYVPAKFKALPGTPEYIKEQEDLHKQALIEKIKREQEMKEGGPSHGKFHKDKHGRDPWNNWD